jgi:hypothetical protein
LFSPAEESFDLIDLLQTEVIHREEGIGKRWYGSAKDAAEHRRHLGFDAVVS